MRSTSPGDDGLLADVATALIDARGVVVSWSDAASRLLAREAEDVRGRSVLRLVADPAGLPRGLPEADGGPLDGTVRLGGGAGQVDVEYRVLPTASPDRFLVLAVPADRAADVRHGTTLLRALLAQDAIGVVLRDTDLAVVRTNRTPGLFGEVPYRTGTRLADVMHAEDAAKAEASLREVLATGEPVVNRKQRVRSLATPSAEWDFSVSAVRLEDGGGRPDGVVVLLTDATEQFQAAHRLELRHRMASTVGRSLDIIRTAQDIADVLVPAFGDLAWVDLAADVLNGDEPSKTFGGGDLNLRRAAVCPGDAPWAPELLQPGASIPPLPDRPLVRLLQQGRAVTVDRATLEHGLADPDFVRATAPEKGHSLAVAPLFARGLVLGLAAVWRTERPEPFDQRDVDLLSEVASHAALAVDNARRYTREHRAAVALQEHLLPQAVTRTTVLETAGHYLPASGGAEIGGDWYDAIALPSLRTALVVGDVTGHGLHASATMGRLRTAVHTLADLELAPDELLTHLDDLVTRVAAEAEPGQRDVVGATCLVVLHDPVAGQCTVAAAGHPPPVLVLPDGGAEPVALRPGPPLGVGGMPFETTTVDVPPGSLLALFTDGLIERCGGEVSDVVARLSPPHDPAGSLQALGRALVASDRPHAARDDTALLLARTASLPADAVARWEFPTDPAAVAGARTVVTEQLAAWGLDEIGFTTELIVSELVTNAIRYTKGPVGLRLIRDTSLICEVSDPSNTQPRLRRARITDEGGRGLFLVAQLAGRWGSRYGPEGKTIWTEQPLPS
ncbi:GAF domain-containing protein [Streptomyces sp. ms191]|uniref:ATP-binding SpoIIE family protein phosphatase n=1 Tax=Streptomyces sp. ms191 TaxID=1827978 RepID=UPI0011CD6822|nr:SpoIIE family protein phosphatase [Streptomyces sp. ms191]TXS19857.1 GAF domain-containing protein [Streptomyces sp. ms191]